MRKVLCLGASGSIGEQTLDILFANADRFEFTGFSLGKRVSKIPAILARFPQIRHICVQNEEDYLSLKEAYPGIKWHFGDEGLVEIIQECDCDMVVNALVGFAGLRPSLVSLEENKILCLANKESLVVGGSLINALLSQGKGKLYPIDSEHVAIAKLLSRVRREDVDEVWITASGGSFRDKRREELSGVSKEMALAHPTWAMGAKITIDSATMMNKGFEVLEAKWLYDFPLERTKIIMHRESHVHSLLHMKDGSFLADISAPDMHGPISYALFESKVDFDLVKADSLEGLGPYHFAEFDPSRFPSPGIAIEAYKKGGSACAVLNGANEAAVYAFLDGKLPFLCIEEAISAALRAIINIASPTYEDLARADKESREFVRRYIEERREK